MKDKRRVYKPRIVDGKVMLPADLERRHKYMLEVECIDHISDEMLSKANGRSWPTSCRRRSRKDSRPA